MKLSDLSVELDVVGASHVIRQSIVVICRGVPFDEQHLRCFCPVLKVKSFYSRHGLIALAPICFVIKQRHPALTVHQPAAHLMHGQVLHHFDASTPTVPNGVDVRHAIQLDVQSHFAKQIGVAGIHELVVPQPCLSFAIVLIPVRGIKSLAMNHVSNPIYNGIVS